MNPCRTIVFQALVLQALALALTLLPAGAAHAREGFYIGFGAVQQTVGGDFDGTHTLANPSGSNVFFDGKLDTGDVGMDLQIGYGLNRFFGLEFMYANSQHSAKSTQLDKTTDAEFTSQVYGVRLTAPFGQSVEAFLRAGYSLYAIALDNFARSGVPLTQSGNVTFHGAGTAIGTGLELYFGNWRWGLGYTQHNYKLDRAKPAGGRSLALPQDLSGVATTTDLTLAYHFGT
jgi:hypothetical protein